MSFFDGNLKYFGGLVLELLGSIEADFASKLVNQLSNDFAAILMRSTQFVN